MVKNNYNFKSNYNNNSFQNTKVIKYYLYALFSKTFYFALVVLSVVVINISISNIKFDSIVRNSVLFMTRPIFVIAEAPFNLFFDFLVGTKNLVLTNFQNRRLIEENIALKKLYIESLDTKTENLNLKKLLNFKNSIDEKYTFVTSRLYINSKNGMNETIIIGSGSSDDIKEGNLVLGKNRSVIGRVINVDKNHSNILLLNDINSKIPARTASTNERVILSGTNKEYLELTYFNSKSPEIIEGDYIYTSGDSDMIPDGFYIGKVKKYENEFIVEINESTNSIFNVMVVIPVDKE